MNEDLLASAVSDWLKVSDTPPANPSASRARAVARASEARQAIAWRPGRPWGAGARVPVPAMGLLIAALAVLVVGLAAVMLLRPTDEQSALVPGGRPSIVPAEATMSLMPSDADVVAEGDPVAPDARASSATASTTTAARGGDAVTITYGRSTLRGRVWPDGTVRVLDDGAGNATDVVDAVVVAPDDTVWIARNKAIFALGQEGKYRPPGQPRSRITSLSARPDGSLEVRTYRALWHFDDGDWTQLPTPPEIAHESDLEGYFPEPMPDGSVWAYGRDTHTVARYGDDGWAEYPLSEILPESFPQQPERDIRIDLGGARDGTIWVAPADGPVSLAHFDGAAWTEYPEAFIEEVVGREPVRMGDIHASSDGTVWILFGVDGNARELVRIKDGKWSSTPIHVIRKKARVSNKLPLSYLAQASEDGAVQLYTGEDEHRQALWWNGKSAQLLDFGVFIPEGETSDGILWGRGRNKDVGLLMRPTTD